MNYGCYFSRHFIEKSNAIILSMPIVKSKFQTDKLIAGPQKLIAGMK